jgi:foldase protein PrsA
MQIIASVDKYSISQEEFVDRYGDYLASTSIKDNIVTRRAILNNMISELVLKNFDANSRIESDPEFQKEINWSEKQTILAFLKDREIFAKINVSEEEIRDAFYKSNEKIAARHLFAEAEEEANNLYQLLQTGASFDELAEQVFTDSTLASNGGYLGYFSWGDMDPNFEDVAYSLSVGEISKPVKTRYGYSVIKLEDRFPNPLLTDDEFLKRKSHMERVVKIRKKKPSEIDFINRLYDQNKIWFDEKIVGNIYDNFRYSTGIYLEKQNIQALSSICLRYDKRDYTRGEIEKRITEIPLYHLERINSTENLKTVLKGIVIQDLLFDMAKTKKYHNHPEVLSKIQKYKTNLFLKYKRKEISDNSDFPDSVIRKFYDDNLIYFMSPRRINVQEIIIRDKQLADSIVVQIGQGSDFGMLAEKFSIREWSAKNKGILGISELDKFGILKDTLWNASIDKIVGPIKIQDYYGIFKIIEKLESSPREFSIVKNDALRLLKKEKSRDIMASYLNRLTSKLKIEVNEKLLSTAEIRTGI